MSLERLRTAYRLNKSSLSRDELYELIELIFSLTMKQNETSSMILSCIDKIHMIRIEDLEEVNQRLENDLTPEQNMIQ